MIKKENSNASQEASKDEVLTRRAAMKRIAAGLAGVGIVAVVGIMGQVQSPTCSKTDWWDEKPYDNSAR